MQSFTKFLKPDYEVKWFHKHLCEMLDKFERGEIKKLMVLMPPQHGKEISHNTPIFTPIGWRLHGDLRPGDYVFGRDGQPVKVIAISDDCLSQYDVTFTDGTTIQCHGNHEWVVFDRHRNGRNEEIVVDAKYLSSHKLWSGTGNVRGNRARFQVDPNTCIEGEEKNLPIDPYTLGAWLGDGTTTNNCITHHVSDTQVIDSINEVYPVTAINVHKTTGAIRTGFKSLYAPLKKYGLIGFKHIPVEYLTASVEQRLELLAGLIDTDGYVYQKNGRITFSGCDKRLIEDVRTLVVGLGMRATICAYQPITSTSGIVGRSVVYQLCFNPLLPIPTRIPRKKTVKTDFTIRRRGITCVVPSKNPTMGRCIQVEGGVYLVGETLIPTHNSELTSRKFPAYLIGKNPERKIAFVTYNDTMSNTFNRAIQRAIDNPDYLLMFPDTMLTDSKHHKQRESGKQRNTDIIEVLKYDGSIKTLGRGGSLTGNAVDIGIIDDPLKDREEAMSDTIRNKLWEWYSDVFKTRLHNGSQQLLIQTRWHEGDLSGLLLKKENDWNVVCFPAIRTADQNDYDPRAIGEALWPEKHSLESILKVKAQSEVTFNALYQQDPKPNTVLLVFPKAIEVNDFPADADASEFIWGVDYGYTNDPTAIVKVLILGDNVWAKECCYAPGIPAEQIQGILNAHGYVSGQRIYSEHDLDMIARLRRMGLVVYAARKGANSINSGVIMLNNKTFHYIGNNFRAEVKLYQFTAYGEVITNIPLDKNNHLCDATRYAVYSHSFR